LYPIEKTILSENKTNKIKNFKDGKYQKKNEICKKKKKKTVAQDSIFTGNIFFSFH